MIYCFRSIVVEFAKESRPRREPHEDRGNFGYDSGAVMKFLLTRITYQSPEES